MPILKENVKEVSLFNTPCHKPFPHFQNALHLHEVNRLHGK